jgi:hypothetical protein
LIARWIALEVMAAIADLVTRMQPWRFEEHG